MEQSPGFVTDCGLVCWLKKSLYGLKQAPHALYESNDNSFFNTGFKHFEFDCCIYVLHVHSDTLIIALYVDDLIITGNNVNMILGLKKQLDLGLFHFFLGIQNFQMDAGIFLS